MLAVIIRHIREFLVFVNLDTQKESIQYYISTQEEIVCIVCV